MEITLSKTLPPYPSFVEGIRRAPDRGYTLNQAQTATALKNALRYIPKELHETLAPEFMEELRTRGRIYGYRYRPQGDLKAKPIDEYKGNCVEGKAFQVMIDNNLCFDIALYPYELVTYGETGQVCQNWMQYRLIKQYLEVLTREQTLVIESGHPLGLFKSKPEAPRVIITNALMVGLYDNPKDWHTAMQMGVANYGQMTAGGWMYIGPQGIVHGTFNTLLNAGRLKLGIPQDGDLRGRLFVSSGLGGMSGAQPKAAEMAGAAAIIAEVDASRIETRHTQGWVGHVTDSLPEAFALARQAMENRRPISVAYHGNVVDVLEYAVSENLPVDLLSDQTSCHAAYEGGYCPAGLTFGQRTRLLHENPEQFRTLVDASLERHFKAIETLVKRGTYFFDYGNSFMKAVYDAGVRQIARDGDDKNGFIFPSYVEDIMGPELFDYGYGPFRWVCLSGKHEDLVKTDRAAMECIDPNRRGQDLDNYNWIRDAEKNNLVVGTQARILYQDAEGRMKIALRFNEMVRRGAVG
ncbi:urocanate hydratase, partial [Bacteroides heparinolyticus]|uniref:urocanate hydratase n=1 Tax=Prevotella heparinolytica TaxID=28113 RepID=UPI00359F8932